MSIYTILACIGLMFILKYGTILNSPRRFLMKCEFLRDLLTCSLCLGFWTGTVIGLIVYNSSPNDDLLLLPLVSAASCWIVDNINNVIQSIEIKIDKE